MSADASGVAGALAPGFAHFMTGIAVLLVASIALAVVGWRARPALARRARAVNRYLLLGVLSAIVLFPIYITVVTSLLPADRIANRPPTLFPTVISSGYSQ